MSITVNGTSGNLGVAGTLLQPVDQFSGVPGTRKGTRTHLIDYSDTTGAWMALVPAVGDAHPVVDTMEFVDMSLSQERTQPGKAMLVLKYEELDFGGGGGGSRGRELAKGIGRRGIGRRGDRAKGEREGGERRGQGKGTSEGGEGKGAGG